MLFPVGYKCFPCSCTKFLKKRIEKLYLKCYNIQKQNERNEDDLLNTKKIFSVEFLRLNKTLDKKTFYKQ